MKKILLFFLLLWSLPLYSQQTPSRERSFIFNSATTSEVIDNAGSGINLHRVQWTSTATIPICTFTLQGSHDNSTFATIISSTTCTTPGTTTFWVGNYSYIRINVATLTANAGLSMTYSGFKPIPSSSSIVDNTSSSTPLQIIGSTELFPAFGTGALTTQGGITSGLWTISTNPGIFVALTVGAKASQANSFTRCYDSTSTATLTNQIIAIDTTNFLGQIVLGQKVSNGIVCAGNGSSTVMINYR